MWFLDFTLALHKRMPEHIIQGYENWRESFSKKPPVDMDAHAAATDLAAEVFYFKMRLAVEGKKFNLIQPMPSGWNEGQSFGDFLDVHFKPGVILPKVADSIIPNSLLFVSDRHLEKRASPFVGITL
jgi:hypothetical protein